MTDHAKFCTYWTTAVHGLTHEDTDNQPAFPEVWAQIEGRIAGLPLVAHNSPFDESCLKAVFFFGGGGEGRLLVFHRVDGPVLDGGTARSVQQFAFLPFQVRVCFP